MCVCVCACVRETERERKRERERERVELIEIHFITKSLTFFLVVGLEKI